MTALRFSDSINPIYFKDFEKFKSLTKNTSQAEFLCHLVYHFKTTKYILEDGRKWFTRTRNYLAKECGISLKTVSNYLRELEQKGFIRRTTKVFKKTNLYITITDKLMCLLGLNKTNKLTSNLPSTRVKFTLPYNNKVKIYNNTPNTPLSEEEKNQNKNKILSSNTNTTEPEKDKTGIAKKSANLADNFNPTLSDYSEYEKHAQELSNQKNELNKKNTPKPEATEKTQTKTKTNNFSSNTKNTHKTNQIKRVSNAIGKKLTEVQEKYIASTVRNLSRKIEITKPQQLIEEIQEATVNPKRFSNAKTFKHKINTIAQCITVGRWRNPVNFEAEQVQNNDTFNPARISVDNDTGALTIEAEQSAPQSKYSADDFTPEEEAFWQELESQARERKVERDKL